MTKKILSLIILGFLAFAPFSWSAQEKPEKGKGYVDVNSYELYQMLKEKDFILINTHIPYAGEIPQTDLFIPYDEIEKHADTLPHDKDAKIVIYCRSDRMSNIASLALVKMGYTNILNFEGGMKAWKEAGYPLIQEKKDRNY